MSDRNLSARLDACKRHIVTPAEQPASPPQPSRYHKLADALSAQLVSGSGGCFCIATTLFPEWHSHGRASVGDVIAPRDLPLSAFSADDVDGSVDSSRLLYVDTETTGLGGAGAVPFLVGLGAMTPDGFEIRQYLIPDYSDEAAMLESLHGEFQDDLTLVSYNGAAFDLPLLTDRLVINRVARSMPDCRHLDLLHPARRLFKRRLRDCSLVNVEREIFGFHRIDDLPGYLVPSVYFSWLADESLDLMPRVLEHNRLDIISLAFLARHLADVFACEGEQLAEVDDIYSLSRVYGRRRRLDKVVQMGARLDVTGDTTLSSDILLYHAQAFKRMGRWGEAVGLWEQLAGREGREAYWASLELAKYFEHEIGEHQRALDCARLAQRLCPYGHRHDELLARRLDRLKARVSG